MQYGCFESFPFRQKKKFSSARSRDFDGTPGTELPVSMYTTKTFDPQLLKILTFSVKDRYQINYFICIKDFNAETNTSLKLNLFSLFAAVSIIKGKQSAFMYIFLISDRQWGVEHQYLFSGFLGVSMLQLLIIYRIYDYDMLTLSP
jgi:hypothetical protein